MGPGRPRQDPFRRATAWRRRRVAHYFRNPLDIMDSRQLGDLRSPNIMPVFSLIPVSQVAVLWELRSPRSETLVQHPNLVTPLPSPNGRALRVNYGSTRCPLKTGSIRI